MVELPTLYNVHYIYSIVVYIYMVRITIRRTMESIYIKVESVACFSKSGAMSDNVFKRKKDGGD